MAEAPKVEESLGKKAAQAAGTAEHKDLIKSWDKYGAWIIRGILGGIGLILLLIFGLPALVTSNGSSASSVTMWTVLIIGLIVGGGALMFGKRSGGGFLIFLGVVLFLIGPATLSDAGNGLRNWLKSSSDDAPLPTTGQIHLVRKFQNPQPFALGDTYRRIDVPPGTELCADPIDKIAMRADSTPAVKYVRSDTRGVVVHINFYLMPYGHDCVLLPPTPDPRARSQNDLSRQTHASG